MTAALANPPNAPGWENGKGRFLIDGFPRKMDQALMFDKAVRCRSQFPLHHLVSVSVSGGFGRCAK